jgi:hypothetical protein
MNAARATHAQKTSRFFSVAKPFIGTSFSSERKEREGSK